MSRYNIKEFIPGYSAMVSSHGHFSVVRGKESPGYQSGIWNTGMVRGEGGVELPTPVFVYEGDTDEMGVKYDPSMDGLAPEVDDYDIIKSKLKEWSKTRPDLFTNTK